MGIRSFVSFGLVLVPVAVTLGVLLGLDAYRTSNGQSPLFVDNSVKTEVYCQKSFGIHPKSNGEEFTLNPNQWGWNPSEGGASCVHVKEHKNGSYASNITAPEWWVTWQYPPKDPNEPVHGYPNIILDTEGIFPVQMSEVRSIPVDLEWAYTVGSEPGSGYQLAELTSGPVNAAANVAIDMFFASDKSKANPEDADFEVMVWLGYFNPATQPLGYPNSVGNKVVNGIPFTLYYGANQFGQKVLSWYATTPSTTLTADLEEFISGLSGITVETPAATDYLGYISLGTETLFATTNVTFSVPKFVMEVVKS